jgi:hypothetical protein
MCMCLVERGLDPEPGMLFVIDGSKAIRRAIARCSATCPPKMHRHQERCLLGVRRSEVV